MEDTDELVVNKKRTLLEFDRFWDEMEKSQKKMRRIMFADKGFRRYWDEKFGMDFLGS